MKKKKFLIVLSALLIMVAMVTACGNGSQGASDKNSNKQVLNVYNWGDFIAEGVIEAFEEKYGIKVNYDTFATNEDMYVKIKSGGSHYDVVIPSDYMIERMIREGMLQKIDFNNVPNFELIDDQFKYLDYDPNNEYSVPYMWGTVGILYNTTMVDEPVDSWDILWNEKYANQILMLDSLRDSIAVALIKSGYSINTRDLNELEAAKQALIEQKPLVLAYVGDEVKDKMIGGEAALALVWSGEAMSAIKENPDLAYAIPKEGSNLWVDAMAIPANAQNKEAAELFINFMCETDIAYKNADYIGYSTAHKEAVKLLPEEILNNLAGYPPIEDLENCVVFKDLGEFTKEYDRIWTEIMAQ
ncbi:MAG TPA: ABC transporter substrate-binding protein [Defluviitaleaceae bacterium]|jgi:spermidine/putrescine transport system substrate-binding protein|nr:ABC transporter substrate-binding protein [Defluviitaleaceae bacterium]HPT77058.1 ABC transporter substrate-binding protein [Defluviitaleaceae bacterium]